MLLLSTILLGASVLVGAVPADEKLSVGDHAPALSIEHFVKGERVDSFPADKVTVVEFWATWCKPCIDGFPHLSELQERYPDELVIIGVSAESLDVVEPFLAKPRHGDVTRYRVASDSDGSMQRDWMTAARQNGIPCAFIVDREGIVRYIGHPMSMDRTLERVITGKAPLASDTPSMSDEERAALTTVEGTHSPEAVAVLETLAADLSAPGGVVAFEQELLLRGALKMGGPDGEAADLRKTRSGKLIRGAGERSRLDAERTMHLPGMPDGGMKETEAVIYDGDRMWLRYSSGSPFMPSPLPTEDWTWIDRDEAQTLADEVPLPLPIAALMELNPVLASPLDLLDALAAMSALEVVEDERSAENLIVLEGVGAPMAGIPDPGNRSGPQTNAVRIEIERSTGVVTVLVGDPQAPSLTMRIERLETDGEPDASLFDPGPGDGDSEPVALLPILRERLEMMRGMAPPPTR